MPTHPSVPPIRNHHPGMAYRRFGATGLDLSVITLGGMRYTGGWQKPREKPDQAMLDECAATVRLALDAGINHIETAYGYDRSEHCYGIVLNQMLKVPRDRYWLMTKGAPKTAEDAKRMVDEQLRGLRTDRIDLYGWHGINTPELLATATAKGGPVEALWKLHEQGVIGSVGFSTHGPLDVLIAAIQTGLFRFMNLHYYYFFQRHAGAVALAEAKDIGVFIISPNDKGGQLFTPSADLRALCAPLTPIQFNARWCLRSPAVHTLSFGMNRPEHFAEMRGIFPLAVPLCAEDLAIQQRLDARLALDPISAWEGHEMAGDPSGINIPEVLRFRRLWKCYGMRDFAVYRYNMLESKGHWFPGCFATDDAIAKVDAAKAPPGIDVRTLLREAHAEFYREKR